ncbi:MAG: hypothetical protein QX203_17580, partial [Methylococcaceae bacterium]
MPIDSTSAFICFDALVCLIEQAFWYFMRGVAIFAKDFSGLLLEKSAKTTRPPMPTAAPIRPASLAVHPTRGA